MHGVWIMRVPLLYLIATGQPAAPLNTLEAVEAAISGGVGMVQMREKGSTQDELMALGRELRLLTRRLGVPLVVNDDPIMAARLDADGVHVGQDDLPVAEVRRVFSGLVGLSTHTAEQVADGVAAGADLLGFGPLFSTETKDAGAPVGVDSLAKARTVAPAMTLIGIGGISLTCVGSVIQAGADGVAICSELMMSEDPEATARAFIREMNAAR